MDQEAGHNGRAYWLKSGASGKCDDYDIKYKYNMNSLEHLSTKNMSLNDIGVATLSLDRSIPFETYAANRILGSFVLIDRYTNATVAAGMINFALRRAKNIHQQHLAVNKIAREALNGHRSRLLWFTGLSGSGKSSIADALEQALHKRGVRTYILDGDNVRHGLNQDLGFSDGDRVENIRRVSEVAGLMVDAGLVVLASYITPFRAEREMASRLISNGEYIEIFVDTPLEEASGETLSLMPSETRRIAELYGVDSPYESLRTLRYTSGLEDSIEVYVQQILDYLDSA